MSCQFEIRTTDTEVTVHSIVELCDSTGITLLRPVDAEKLNKDKLGVRGLALVEALFIEGVTSMELSPYYLKIKVGKLFGTGRVHRTVEEYIRKQWPEAEISGDRTEDAEAMIGFIITSGPSREDIMRVLDGNNPEGDPSGWEALQFKGHKPGSEQVETLVMRFGYLVGRRDIGEDVITFGQGGNRFRERPPQGQRIVWDLHPGRRGKGMVAIGPEPTAEDLKRHFCHPKSKWLHGVFVRYNDVTGNGFVLDEED